MAQLDRQALLALTHLCRIECNEEELEVLLHDLKKVLSYVEQLQEVDTKDVPPCNQVLEDFANVMREDIEGETLSRELFLSNAPAHVGGMIRVPTVIKQH
jgi:aspartyl-tRNA(Asn)/glutamyl-tRNA(Gln) amidotransferase subunit C